VTGPGAYPAG